MQIHDLVKPIDEMTDEELLEKVRQIRLGREVNRPVAKKKAEREEKKVKITKTKKAAKILSDLSPEDLAKLAKLLEGSE